MGQCQFSTICRTRIGQSQKSPFQIIQLPTNQRLQQLYIRVLAGKIFIQWENSPNVSFPKPNTCFRTESTTKWLLNNTSPDERLLTCNWAHTDEVIDARKTPKVARRSNVSGLVDFEPVRRLPPPMSPFVREKIVPLHEQIEAHSYYSLFDPEDNSFTVWWKPQYEGVTPDLPLEITLYLVVKMQYNMKM